MKGTNGGRSQKRCKQQELLSEGDDFNARSGFREQVIMEMVHQAATQVVQLLREEDVTHRRRQNTKCFHSFATKPCDSHRK